MSFTAVFGPNGSGKSNVEKDEAYKQLEFDQSLSRYSSHSERPSPLASAIAGWEAYSAITKVKLKQMMEIEPASEPQQLKHEACCAAYAQKQLDTLRSKIVDETSSKQKLQQKLKIYKLEALGLRKFEQECLKVQEALIPLEQASRQKVMKLTSAMEVREILKAKATNEIEGIYGRLGDLGSMDSDYDIAISTACPRLDNSVVETTAAEQACAEMLRQRKLGGATKIMILEKQTDDLSKMKKTGSPPEGKRLFDLVKVDRNEEKIKVAVSAALRNTVVANDIDQASHIARAEKELSEVVEKLRALGQRISGVVFTYQSVDKSISHLEMELAESQIKVNRLNSLLDYLEKQLDSPEAGSLPSKQELDRLIGRFIVPKGLKRKETERLVPICMSKFSKKEKERL